MSTAVTFEAGTIADCMKKAARVAPAKVGSAFDKAAGIVFDITPDGSTPCVVRATDTEVFYIETIDVLKAEGDPVRWRLPSQLLASVIGTIPPTSGRTVTFSQTQSTQVDITSMRMRAKMILNANPYYPEWNPADGITLTVAPDFGASLARVEWAAAKGGPAPLNGIHINGTHLVSSDRYRVARVPCEIDLPAGPVTIPAWSIASLLKQMGDVRVGVEDTLFIAMPDDFTQIKTVTYGSTFLPVDKVTSLAYEHQIAFSKTELMDRIQKATSFAGADRLPTVAFYIGREEFALMMRNDEVGMFGDVIELPGQAEHPRVVLRFTPKMITDALNNAPNETVIMKYTPDNVNRPVCIEGGSGFEAWIAPRAEKAPDA